MSVEYDVVPKRSPRDLQAPVKWYPLLKRKETVSTEEISRNISARCSLNPADVQAALIALSHEIRKASTEGKAIRLDHLGTFSLGINGEGLADPTKVRPWHIKKAYLRFHPDHRIKTWLKELHFLRVKKIRPRKGA